MKEQLKGRIDKMIQEFGYESSYASNMLYALENPEAYIDETSVTIYDENVSLIHKDGFKIGNHSLTWTIYELYGQYKLSKEEE